MALLNFTFNADALYGDLDAIQSRMASPFGGACGDAAVEIMRSGPGSVADQFEGEYEGALGSTFPWVPTRSFGIRPRSQGTLHATGHLAASWAGGEDSFSLQTSTSVEIGSNAPFAEMFQSDFPTIVRPGARGARAMQLALGGQFDVWLTLARLAQGLRIVPRRVGVGSLMYNRVASLVVNYILNGIAAESN